MLAGRFITMGISGSIAVYKAAELASMLTKAGAEVHVIMTAAAQEFVRPLTFQVITGNMVHTDMFGSIPGWLVPHIELATRSSLFVVAPATANIIAKVAHGLADDLLTTTLLATSCPVLFCPAMNVNMYKNSLVQTNLSKLKEMGYHIMEPSSGRLACGSEGAGRLPEPAEIFDKILQLISPPAEDLRDLVVMVTAGGTREPIDPVRFISNRSSGKMGYALARAAHSRGAKVILISAPTNLTAPPGVTVIQVESAIQMYHAVLEHFPQVDVVIKAAAVADYRPVLAAEHKIKKEGQNLILELEQNPDILQEIGRRKKPHQIVVGFAAETRELEENARQKLKKKNLDLLVANDITQPGAGFGTDTNVVKIFYPDGQIVALPIMDKFSLANHILDIVLEVRSRKLGVGN